MRTQAQEVPRPRDEKAAYQAKRRTLTATLYFPTLEALERFQSFAEAAGYGRNFSAWCVQMLHHATSGHLYPPGYVDDLKRDNDRWRSYYETARDEAETHRAQAKQLEAQLRSALVHLASTTEGAELAMRFLSQDATTQERGASA